MKNKTITRGALWAAVAVAALICAFMALQLRSSWETETSQEEDDAYLAQLIAQYRAAVEFDPFPHARENGSMKIEDVRAGERYVFELLLEQGEWSAREETFEWEHGQKGELLEGVYYIGGKRYGYSAADGSLTMVDAQCPYKTDYETTFCTFRALLSQTVQEPELANWSRWQPEAVRTRPVMACDIPDVSNEPLPNVLQLEFLEPVSVEGLGVVERLTVVVCEEPDEGLTAWVTMGDCTVTVE